MSSIRWARDGDHLVKLVETDVQTAEVRGTNPARVLRVSTAGDGQLVNDGSATETLRVEVVDGLRVARGTDPADADVLDVDDDATLVVDGSEQTLTLMEGSGTLDVSTTAAAGSTIDVVARELASHPAESDRTQIDVVRTQ